MRAQGNSCPGNAGYEPIETSNPFRSSTDKPITLKAELALNAVAEPAWIVPEERTKGFASSSERSQLAEQTGG
jgi:hypothetical protein